MRAHVKEVGKLAHLVDLDFDARLDATPAARGLLFVGLLARGLRQRLGLEPPEVRMVAAEKPAAAGACAAGLGCLARALAKKQLRDALGERELAHAAHAVDEERMGQPRQAAFERIKQWQIPGLHQIPPRPSSRARRISFAEASPSMMRMRWGSDLARAR